MTEILSLKKCLSDNGGLAYSSEKEKYHPTSPKLGRVELVLSGYHRDWWVSCYQNDKTTIIFPDEFIKDMLEVDTKTVEGKAFEKRYAEYQIQRWDEMPKVEVTNENWEELEKKWKLADEQEPEYIIFYLDSSGPIDKVEMVFKDKLSEEDIKLMKKSYESNLKYYKARDLYIKNHPDYSEIWRGPQDDEYEADIMKYYDKDE